MHSQTLRRTRPAPSLVGLRAPVPVARLDRESSRLAFLQELSNWRGSDTFTQRDDRLWNRLLQHIDQPIEALELRGCRRALSRVPAAVMRAFIDARSQQEPVLLHVALPACLSFVPDWLTRCTTVKSVELPGFKGACADLGALPALTSVALGELGWKNLKLVLPNAQVSVTYVSPYELNETREVTLSGACRLKLRLHNLNHATSIPGSTIEIECRHISLVTLGQWAALDWRNLPIDHQPREALAWLHAAHQLESLVSLKTASDFTRLNRKPKDAHVVAIDRWNDFVVMQGDRLRAHGRSHTFALMTTPVHALALVFGIGSDGQCHVVCLDPNFVRHVRRASVGDGLEALFVDFAGNFDRYFSMPDQRAGPAVLVRVTFLSDPLRPKKAITTGPVALNLTFSGLPLTWHPSLVKECLITGAHTAFDQLGDAIERDGYRPSAELMQALVSGQDGAVIWSHKAAEFGHKEALRAWGACLLAAHNAGCLRVGELAQALSDAPGVHRDNLLAAALRASHPKVVSCVLDLLGDLFAAGALSRSDVYLICSFHHQAGGKLVDLVRSRRVARALYRGWAHLADKGALSVDQRERLKEALRPISHRWLPV